MGYISFFHATLLNIIYQYIGMESLPKEACILHQIRQVNYLIPQYSVERLYADSYLETYILIMHKISA